jgi:hypothetical protein
VTERTGSKGVWRHGHAPTTPGSPSSLQYEQQATRHAGVVSAVLTERLHVKDDGGIPESADQRAQREVEVSDLVGPADPAQFACLRQFRGLFHPLR